MNIKRILLISLPAVLLVGAFVVAMSMYNSAPASEAYAKAQFRKQQSKVLTIKGVLVDGGVECQRMQATDGTYYTLTGSKVAGYKTDEVVTVVGKIATASTCMQDTTIDVQSIMRVAAPPAETAPAETKGQSGISGTVTIGPTCPVVRSDDPGACADKPYSTQLEITDKAHPNQPYGVTSDQNGKFRIALPPGTYIVEPSPQKTSARVLPTASPQEVVVKAGKYTEVKMEFDSGIR